MPLAISRLLLSRMSVLFCVLLVAGCADLSAIRDFSGTSADSEAFTKIVNDYRQSDDVRLQYMYPPLAKSGEVERLNKDKVLRAQRAQELQRVLESVEIYMNALGNLASDKVVDTNQSMQDLKSRLDASGAIDPALSKPASEIASLVVKMINDGYRQRNLREAINAGNPKIQAINRSLAKLMERGFMLDLRAEQTAVSDYYDYWHDVALEHHELAAAELIRVQKQETLARYDEKKRALLAYRDVFNKIAAGHQVLFDNQRHLDNKALLKTMRNYAQEIRNVAKTMKSGT